MKYLLVNHIAAARGKDGAHLRLPVEWARDVCATALAARSVGATLLLATPVTDEPGPSSFELVPDQLGFEHIRLPFYDSARSFLHERSALTDALAEAVRLADVVQLDHGGYPISLGHVADPIAKSMGRPTVWIVNGESLPQSSLASTAGNVAKRLVGRSLDRRLGRSLIEHLGSASLVITGTESLSADLRDGHGVANTRIESIDLLESEVASASQLELRTRRLLDRHRPLRFAVAGELNIASGVGHVIRAMHRCLRLRTPIELLIVGDGVERDAFRQFADELNVTPYVKFVNDPAAVNEADVLIDSALTPSAQRSLFSPLALGLAPITFGRRSIDGQVICVPDGYADGLASAMFAAATNREQLVARMLAGVEWARTRTLDAACRKRFAMASSLKGNRSRGAA